MNSPLAIFLTSHPHPILVDVADVKGSTPREAGAFMLVTDDAMFGTIGGGTLEFMAIAHAREMLKGETTVDSLDIPLGPEIGQCCGGRMLLRFRPVDADLAAFLVGRETSERRGDPHVMIFGAGHVGTALVRALSPLPFRVTVVETRDIIEGELTDGTDLRHVALPEAEVASIDAGGAALVMTHDHALDFLIAREALARDDLAYVGMIGSATKRATFAHWLAREHGPRQHGQGDLIDRLILPIGGSTVRDKRPAVIAALVAAELLAVYAMKNPAG